MIYFTIAQIKIDAHAPRSFDLSLPAVNYHRKHDIIRISSYHHNEIRMMNEPNFSKMVVVRHFQLYDYLINSPKNTFATVPQMEFPQTDSTKEKKKKKHINMMY